MTDREQLRQTSIRELMRDFHSYDRVDEFFCDAAYKAVDAWATAREKIAVEQALALAYQRHCRRGPDHGLDEFANPILARLFPSP